MTDERSDLEVLAQALFHAPCGAVIASTDAGGEMLYLNADFTRITGYTLEDVPDVGHWLERAYPDPDYRAFVTGNWERDVSEPGRDVLYRVTCADGEVKPILLRAALLPGERMIVTLVDMSEQQRTQQALRESEARYRSLYETLPVGVVVHSGGKLCSINRIAREILALDPDEALEGREVMDFVHPDSRALAAARVREVYDEAVPQPWVAQQFLRADGSVVDVEVTGSRVEWEGQPASQVVFVDVSERVRAEAQRRQVDDRIQHAQKLESLGVLAGGVAHDFNNLLVGILGNADLALADLPPESAVRANLEGIELAARRAADLARQMLAYSGKGRFVVDRLDLRVLIEEITHLMEASISKKAVLRYAFAEHVPPIEGDATQIRQVLMNLLANASEAIEERSGIITVSTGAMECDRDYLDGSFVGGALEPGLYTYVEVSDTGAGMDEETRARIFDPFFTTKFAGRGLGLAAALGIVRGHGGAIRVYSEPGRGTTFKVLFPARSELAGDASASPASGDVESPGRGATVLLVDDEETVRTVASQMLRRSGFHVITAEDGRAAVSLFAQRADEIDCVVLDLAMPRMDGEEAFRELRRIRADVRVVLSSGYNEQEAIQSFHGKQLAGFVQKPYRAQTLLDAIHDALD